MSESFAPRAEFNIAQEQPLGGVENRAAETAVRGLTSLFARTGGSGGSGGATQENALNAAYIDEMDKVKALEDAGEYSRAAIYRQKIDRNFIAAGGQLNDPSLGAAIKARTGYEMERFAIDPVDQRNAYLDSHSDSDMVYQGLIANGMNPDTAREETRRVISDRLNDQQVLAAAQDRDPAWWERTGRHAFDNNLDYVVDNISGLAAQGIATGAQFDSKSIQDLRSAWSTEKSQTMAALPTYLTDDQKQAVSARFEAIDTQLAALESVAGNDAFMSVFRDRIANRGDMTHEQVMKNMLTELESKGASIAGITGGNVANATMFIETVLEASSEGGGIKVDREFLTALVDPDRNLIDGMQIVPQEEAAELYSDYNPKDRGVAVKDAEALARAGHSIQVHELQTKDVAYAYADTVLGMATAINNIGNNGELLTPASMKRIMGEPISFAEKMTSLQENYPDVYAQVAPQLANALNGQAMVAQRSVESWMRNGKAFGYQLDLIYDPTTRNYYATNEGFLKHMSQNPGGREFAANYKDGKGLVYRKGDRWADANFFSAIESRRIATDALKTFGVVTPAERGEGTGVTEPKPYDVFMDEIDRTEGGGDYDALLNFSNRRGPFTGVKVSEMTLGELYEFSDGTYAEYSRRQRGEVATPMGRYQFVGDTLEYVARKMGLSDDTVFTPEIQDQIFGYHVHQVLSSQSDMGKKMAALRSTWVGFRHTSDRKLRQMITDYEAEYDLWAARASAPEEPAESEIVTTSIGPMAPEMGSAPDAGETGLQTFETEGDFLQAVMDGKVMDGESVVVDGKQTTFEDAKPADREVSEAVEELVVPDPETSPMGPDGEDQDQREGAKPEPKYKKLRDLPVAQRDAVIQEVYAVGGNSDVKVFDNIDDVMDSIFSGEVVEGDVIVVGGRVQVLAYEDK